MKALEKFYQNMPKENEIFDDVSIFQCFFSSQNAEKWADDVIMTSQHPIFAKFSNMISFIDILVLSKFEVIWIIQTEVFHKNVYVA